MGKVYTAEEVGKCMNMIFSMVFFRANLVASLQQAAQLDSKLFNKSEVKWVLYTSKLTPIPCDCHE